MLNTTDLHENIERSSPIMGLQFSQNTLPPNKWDAAIWVADLIFSVLTTFVKRTKHSEGHHAVPMVLDRLWWVARAHVSEHLPVMALTSHVKLAHTLDSLVRSHYYAFRFSLRWHGDRCETCTCGGLRSPDTRSNIQRSWRWQVAKS